MIEYPRTSLAAAVAVVVVTLSFVFLNVHWTF